MGRVPPELSLVGSLGDDDRNTNADRDHVDDVDNCDDLVVDNNRVRVEPGDDPGVDVELVVAEVFGPTFQGEGPSVGRRAGFVRLGRCNLDCTWCDSAYTWDWDRYDPAVELRRARVDAIVAELAAMTPEIVVVTGGEPLLQQSRLVPLLEACRDHGWPVEIETNGTRAPDATLLGLVDRWNVSPKLANSGIATAKRIRPEALAALRASGRAVFKFVVTTESDLDEVARLAEEHDLSPVWIMPEGTDAATVLERSRRLASAVLERGWNLSPRLHILLWGDERGR